MGRANLGSVTTTSAADQVYDRLRAAIGDGSLTRGERITERDLAARLGVSPTPVREALRQLVHERIVDRVGPRTLRVADHDRRVVREAVEMEAVLCGLAARFAARKASPEAIEGLGEVLARADRVVESLRGGDGDREELLEEVLQALRGFHAGIEAVADNPVMEALLSQSRVIEDRERRTRIGERVGDAPEVFLARYRQHRELWEAIVAGDEERAESIGRTHRLDALNQLTED